MARVLFVLVGLLLSGVVPSVAQPTRQAAPAMRVEQIGAQAYIVPVEWQRVQAGVFVDRDDASTVLVVQQGTNRDALLNPILRELAIPEESMLRSTRETSRGPWESYALVALVDDAPSPLVLDLAIRPSNTGFVVAILQTTPQRYPYWRENLWLPLLDTFGSDPFTLRDAFLDERATARTVPGYGVQLGLPQDWQQIEPGSFRQVASSDSFTSLIVRTATTIDAETFAQQLVDSSQIANTLPTPTETYETSLATWTLYRIEQSVGSFDILLRIATAQVGNTAILVSLLQPRLEASLSDDFWLELLDSIALTGSD